MKRISILSALLLMCAMTFAQQALWGGAPVVSPEIHDNNTVTFRLKAPKAVKVQVTGDFLPTQKIKTPFGEFDGPGVADLKENKDGVGIHYSRTAETGTLQLHFPGRRTED